LEKAVVMAQILQDQFHLVQEGMVITHTKLRVVLKRLKAVDKPFVVLSKQTKNK
jgi:hypothetical protein